LVSETKDIKKKFKNDFLKMLEDEENNKE